MTINSKSIHFATFGDLCVCITDDLIRLYIINIY